MSECNPAPTALCPVGFLNGLDICDPDNYKHPPFMFTLWYLALLGKAIYDKVMELINSEGGDGGGGGKDDGGDEGGAEPEEEPAGDEPPPDDA